MSAQSVEDQDRAREACPCCGAANQLVIPVGSFDGVSFEEMAKVRQCSSCGARLRYWRGDVAAGGCSSFFYAIGADGLPVDLSLRTMRVLKFCRRVSGPAGESECICGSKALVVRCEYCSARFCKSCGKDRVCLQCLGVFYQSCPSGTIGRNFQQTLVPLGQ